MQILLQFGMLLRHLLVLALPLVTRSLERLHLAFVVTSLDIGLAEPVTEKAVLANMHLTSNYFQQETQGEEEAMVY